MPFGQQSGIPATTTQVRELLALLEEAGHSSFRDARGPMRLTQRQAGGRFTRDEAAEMIERLQDAAETAGDDPAPRSSAVAPRRDRDVTAPPATPRPATNAAAVGQVLRNLPAEHLAAELQRRGWLVVEPLTPD